MRPEPGYTPQQLVPRTRRAAAARGLRPVAGDLARWGAHGLAGLPWVLAGSRGSFDFQGASYRYLFHRYKLTWLTERAVEVPVIQAIVDRAGAQRVLEVGNVLSHYRPQRHLVVDKYERASGVINRDVLELEDLGPFDLIVAISTLEHVGWDEHPRAPSRAPQAVAALRARLAPGGLLVLTVPAGYNREFEAALRDGRIELTRSAALRREAAGPHWREVSPAEAWSVPYDFLLYSARAVVFAFIEGASLRSSRQSSRTGRSR
jgi:SAM-dependent methyltransferase